MTDLLTVIRESVQNESVHLIVLSRPRGTTPQDPEKITIRPVLIANERRYQFASRIGAQEFHENVVPEALADQIEALVTRSFDQANVFTSAADVEFRRRGDGSETCRRSAPSKAPPDPSHNRTRRYLIPDGQVCPFLVATGIMARSGRVRASRQRKFRQINRYLDIVNDAIRHLPENRPIRIVDFGCGRSYLTFALHHLFVTVHQREVQIMGLDLKPKVIADCQRLSAELGCAGLEFREGDIAQHESPEDIDLCVSLHACDTATDAALAKAVQWNTNVILAVPCCHKELAPQIANADAAALLRHGILRDRTAALATDALRARALDALGYRTQVIEFIDTEHTPKNLMIRAVRTGGPTTEALADYRRFRAALGIQSFALEAATGRIGA